MNARVLIVSGLALLALSAPAARACNITADADHAVRMTQAEPQRAALSAQGKTKAPKATHGTQRSVSRYADYPR